MFRTGHFLLPMPLTCSPSGVERWGAAANPGGDYREMCHHYKISTSVVMKEIKGSTGGRWRGTLGENHIFMYDSWLKLRHLICLSHFILNTEGGRKKKRFIYVSWLRCMQCCAAGEGIQVLWKQQGFTVFHTASEVLHQAFAHVYIKISSHKEMSGVTKSFWPS